MKKLECLKQAFNALNTLAWDNGTRQETCFVGLKKKREVKFSFFESQVMINRNSWGHLYSMARGEILGFMEDKLMRKHLSRMFSLIKNES